MLKITVTIDEAGQRLDKFLASHLQEQSRSQLQKHIKAGDITVNEKNVAVHYVIKSGDIVTIRDIAAHNLPYPTPATTLQKAAMPLDIIADTDNYLVVNKPAGMIVHQAPGEHGPIMIDVLLKKYPAIAKIGEDPSRPGIVHRLDKEVSGVIAVPKTQGMFDHLKSQFKARTVRKEYFALVYGTPQQPEGEISFNIDRSETAGYKMAAVPATGSGDRGKRAVTEFEVIERLGNYTLLNVKPRTGRTHQIRVHLNAYGLPIVGDLVYKPKKLKQSIQLHRIFLHAHRLGFNDLAGSWHDYEAPLSPELNAVLQALRS
ncbi:MAG: RluA family pseudouridine synthase [Patescibacteria group bacterium]|nr:RluA family pseudouridine synthase [Patescibacteria group bacterium]MDD5715600.1 RluA family pseudouridine synthase [Patescibacteria group bacterium]